LDGDVCKLHPRVLPLRVVNPLGRVALLKGHELEGDWEVDEVQVDIIELQVAQRLAQGWLHVLLGVVGVPELGSDEQVLPLHHPLLNAGSNGFSHLLHIYNDTKCTQHVKQNKILYI
jgi:hypothetical protein